MLPAVAPPSDSPNSIGRHARYRPDNSNATKPVLGAPSTFGVIDTRPSPTATAQRLAIPPGATGMPFVGVPFAGVPIAGDTFAGAPIVRAPCAGAGCACAATDASSSTIDTTRGIARL